MSGTNTNPDWHLDHDTGMIQGTRATLPQLSAAECPIEGMYEKHFNQRELCADMDALAATAQPRPDLARRILVNLSRDLPAHFEDEEQALFPTLRARALPEDELEKILTRLEREHEIAKSAFALLNPALACMVDGAPPMQDDRDALWRLSAAESRHLIVENAILPPLARMHLTPEDKRALLAEMCARREQSPRMDSACARALAKIEYAAIGEQT
ncbi:MAG: hypothetical protein EA407_10960 [Rhodobacteraceae bacterium]|nr:MAG: hypothetical protein EA407_10960 [Paracoccaceae bacterium]